MIRYISICSVLVVIACAPTNSTLTVQPDRETLIRLERYTTAEAIQYAEENVKKSKQKELDFYAPEHFNIANQAVNDARNLLQNNQPRDKVYEKVAVAETLMKNGDLMMRKVKTALSDEIALKQHLDTLNTSKTYGGEYGNILMRLEEIIRQVENGRLNEVSDKRAKLKQDMGQLQIRAIRQNALHEAEEILKRVTYSGGANLAPVTYQEANEVFQRADDFIVRNPYSTDAVEKAGKEALFAAKRAMYITQEVAALSTKVNTSIEQVVLDEEYRLARIARVISTKDSRDGPLEMQSEKIASAVGDLVTQSTKQEDLIVALRDTLIKVRDAATTNQIVKQLKQEKSEWLAKDALYSAKISQLTSDLKQKEAENALLKKTSVAVVVPQKVMSPQEPVSPVIAHNSDTPVISSPSIKTELTKSPQPEDNSSKSRTGSDEMKSQIDTVLEKSTVAVPEANVASEPKPQATEALVTELLEAHESSVEEKNLTPSDEISDNAEPKSLDELKQRPIDRSIAEQIKSFANDD